MIKKSKTVILMIAVITGFTCTFPTMFVQGKSTTLVLNAIAPKLPAPPPTIIFIEDGVLHIKDLWGYHSLVGTVGGEEITGYTQTLFHVKQDLATGNVVAHGQCWIGFTWGDLTGYFTGPVNGKIVSGEKYGKFTLQGFEDFEGMKLFGIFWAIDDITNGIYGTILVPN